MEGGAMDVVTKIWGGIDSKWRGIHAEGTLTRSSQYMSKNEMLMME